MWMRLSTWNIGWDQEKSSIIYLVKDCHWSIFLVKSSLEHFCWIFRLLYGYRESLLHLLFVCLTQALLDESEIFDIFTSTYTNDCFKDWWSFYSRLDNPPMVYFLKADDVMLWNISCSTRACTLMKPLRQFTGVVAETRSSWKRIEEVELYHRANQNCARNNCLELKQV